MVFCVVKEKIDLGKWIKFTTFFMRDYPQS